MKNKFLNYTFFCFIFLNNIISATDNTNGQQAATTTTDSKPKNLIDNINGQTEKTLKNDIETRRNAAIKYAEALRKKDEENKIEDELIKKNKKKPGYFQNLLKYTKRTSLIFAGLGIAAYGANKGCESYNNKGFIFDTLNKIKNKEIFDLTDKNDNNKKGDEQKNNNDQQSDLKDKNISNKADQQKNNNESANKSITAGTIAAITTATAAISLAIIYIYKKITDYKNSKKTKEDVNQNTKTVKYKAVA